MNLNILTFLVADLVGGEVPEDLVRGGVLPDPVLVLDDLPVPEPDLLLALGHLLHLWEGNRFNTVAIYLSGQENSVWLRESRNS